MPEDLARALDRLDGRLAVHLMALSPEQLVWGMRLVQQLELELLGGSGQPLRWPLTLFDLLPLLVLQGVPPVESPAA